MIVRAMPDEIRTACHLHARLLDAFIELTQKELGRLSPGFAEESLRESLEQMRAARKAYGAVGGVMVVSDAA